ncbi:MAG: PHP domain-containing protein [Bacilli bacterium]|nr:PHP domain-containing protein [Bacilli bacterium]
MEDMHIHLKKGVNDYEIMKEYINRCIELGLKKVIFLDHGNRTTPNHKSVLNNDEVISKFLELVELARSKYKNINIYTGIEVDYSKDEEFRRNEEKLMNNNFDYILGSVHGIKLLTEEEYYKNNIDLIDSYKIDILCHLRLYDNYLEYNYLIEEIVKKCSEKNIKIEINTSNRSLWSLEQFEYMMNLFRKYKVDYVVGSDSHNVDELGTNYNLIKSYFKNRKREIDYSIISRGTEKNGSKGYMSVSKIIDGYRYLLVQDHKEKNIVSFKDSLNCYDYDIYNIAFSRFELIPHLVLNRNNFKDNILICGLGNVGLTTLVYLLDNNYKIIDIYTNDLNKYVIDGIKILNKNFDIKLNLVEKIDKEYNTYIDTTGASSVLKNIFENIKFNKDIFLIGTPRESKFLIDPLLIHRNNLRIIGGHELRGIDKKTRQDTFKELLQTNKNKKYLNRLINITQYDEGIIERKLQNKSNFIEVIKYDD